MARDPYIEQRLINWAKWVARGSTGGLGYASTAWDAFDAGDRYSSRAPVMPEGEEAITDQAVKSLVVEHQDALVARYVQNLTVDQYASKLECHPETVRMRIVSGERGVSAWLAERERVKDAERERVERLRSGVSGELDRRQADAARHATDVARPVARKRRRSFPHLG